MNPFPEWLTEVVADTVVVCPDDIAEEARGNQWSFSLSPDQAAAVSAADVEAFAAGVAEARQAWLMAHGARPMVLYWWHDAQAGQLRFSLVSAAHGRLPFGCEVVRSESFSTIVDDWLGSPYLQGVPWADLQPLGPGEVGPEYPKRVLEVWSVRVP